MRFPLRLTTSMVGYIAKKKIARQKRFPLVLMLEPLHACNLTCTGCGRIREYSTSMKERLSVEVREADDRFKAREAQAREDEAVVRRKLTAIEEELAIARAERATVARELPPRLLADYERIARARGGVAVVPVVGGGICGGCRMAIRPQALQELLWEHAGLVRDDAQQMEGGRVVQVRPQNLSVAGLGLIQPARIVMPDGELQGLLYVPLQTGGIRWLGHAKS